MTDLQYAILEACNDDVITTQESAFLLDFYYTEKAKSNSIGAKIKAALEKFKAWIKKIIEKVKNRIGLKTGKDKIKVHKDLSKSLNQASSSVKKLSSAKDKASIAVAIAGVGTAAAALIKCKSLKDDKDAVMKEKDEVQQECAKKLEEIQNEMNSLQSRYDNLNAANDESATLFSKEIQKLREENEKLKAAQTELRDLKQAKKNSDSNIATKIKGCENRINQITKTITTLQDKINKSVPNDESYKSDYSQIISCIHDIVMDISLISSSIEMQKEFISGTESNSETSIFAQIKTVIDSHNRRQLPYLLSRNVFDVDPDYRLHRRAYQYLVKTWPEGFDEHKEMTPLKENPKDLTEEDYLHILLDSTENFSKKRMDYLIKVSPIVKADRMKRLYGENK